MKIMITSVGTATSVNLIKYFSRLADIKIVGVDINAYGFTAGSTMVDSFYPVPYATDETYLSRIKEIAEIESVDCLIPINDLEVKVFANEETLPFTCVLPSTSVVKETMNKKICTRIVNEIGCAVPLTVACEEKVKRIVRDIHGVGSRGIAIYEADDVIEAYNSNKQFIQQYIPGQEYTVDVLSDRQGTPIYIIPRKRIEVKAGVATKVFIENNEKLIALTRKICNRFSIPGFSNVQFIESNGEYYFIEINCRFSGCGGASALACPDLLDDFTKIIKGEEIVTGFNQNIKWNSIVTRYYEEVIVSCDSL